mgnify:CR=1 FL=1|tara:strand:+ start:639 stop:788 length:150 start_codon:yes stop_codon:yes gene_type:complete
MGNNKNVEKIFKKLTKEEKRAMDSYYKDPYKTKLPKVKKIELKKGGRAK